MFTFLCLFVEPGNAAFVKSVAIAMRGGFGGRKRNVLGFVFAGNQDWKDNPAAE